MHTEYKHTRTSVYIEFDARLYQQVFLGTKDFLDGSERYYRE